MAAKETITVKLRTLKKVFSWIIWNMPTWYLLSKEICMKAVLLSLWVHHVFPVLTNGTAFAKLKSFATADILSVFFVKPQTKHKILIMTPTIYTEDI